MKNDTTDLIKTTNRTWNKGKLIGQMVCARTTHIDFSHPFASPLSPRGKGKMLYPS